MAFWRALGELSTDRDIGLRLGSEKTPEQLNLAEVAAIHAPTLGEALPRIARYKRLVCSEEVSIERRKGEVSIGFHWIHARGPIPHLLLECVFAAVVKLVRLASGEALVPRRLELSRRRADARVLRAHFGCPIVFDAPRDRLVLDASDLERRFRPRDPARYARLLPSIEAGVATRPVTFTDEVRGVMRRWMVGEQVTITRIARDLARTPRTLQRHLVKEGTSYQALLDDVRHGTARRLLEATDLQDGEIASCSASRSSIRSRVRSANGRARRRGGFVRTPRGDALRVRW